MILAISIGNSNITFGCMDGETVVFTDHVQTLLKKTDLEYFFDFEHSLAEHSIRKEEIGGAVLASVVPEVTLTLGKAVHRLLSITPVYMSAKNGSSLVSHLTDPKSLGTNLLADSLAVRAGYPLPAVFIDMATSTTIGVLNEEGEYLGGAILPGMQSSLDELTKTVPALSSLRVEKARKLVGTNTTDCLQAGALYGNAAMVDGMLERITAELMTEYQIFTPPTYILTGRSSYLLLPYLYTKVIHDESLTLKGLALFYQEKQKEAMHDSHD